MSDWIARAVAGVALLVVILLAVATQATTPETVTYSTFTDDADRVCTTATTASSVAIDCDFPPAENRLGGWLDGLSEQP